MRRNVTRCALNESSHDGASIAALESFERARQLIHGVERPRLHFVQAAGDRIAQSAWNAYAIERQQLLQKDSKLIHPGSRLGADAFDAAVGVDAHILHRRRGAAALD